MCLDDVVSSKVDPNGILVLKGTDDLGSPRKPIAKREKPFSPAVLSATYPCVGHPNTMRLERKCQNVYRAVTLPPLALG